MSDMPMEIWAWMGMQDNGSWDPEPCPCCHSVKYHHDDKFRALEAENKRLRAALTDIGVYGCGMLSQAAAANMPDEKWLKMRLAEYETVARNALAATPAPDSTPARP